jgi:hypothetical protein
MERNIDLLTLKNNQPTHDDKSNRQFGDVPQGQQPVANSELIDIGKLRLSQDFGENLGAKKVIATIPVSKPSRQSFVRCRPGEEWQLATAILELKEERESYIVTPDLWDELALEITPRLLCVCISRQGNLFLWPVKLPGADGRLDAWSESAMAAAHHATKSWIRLVANMSLGAYEIWEATGNLPEPEWPDLTLQQMVNIAFKGRLIDNLDHPVIRKLQGAA